MQRREFVGGLVGSGMTLAQPQRRSILNYNERMEYRRLGRTGLMVSAVCLGGHWKRVATVVPGITNATGYAKEDAQNINNSEFLANRHAVVSKCIELGINYVDACAPEEILAYSRVLKGRRDKMYFGFSWHTAGEVRYPAKKLMEVLDAGLKEAGLDYVDLWRITIPMLGIPDLGELRMIEEAAVVALETAKKQGKARFTGVSSHNPVWLKSFIEEHPKALEVVLFPYTAFSKELPNDSVFDAIKKNDTGVFAIKPFGANSLFAGDSSPNSPHAQEDDRRARLTLRYVLNNPAITAPIPGMVNLHQVENAALAVAERRKLDLEEKAELEETGKKAWAKLPEHYAWLKDWEYV